MNKFVSWLVKPIEDALKPEETKIKEETIVEIENEQKTYRPQTFKEYVGQKRAKELVENYIIAIKKRQVIFPHTLISGKAGMGKTTLVKIIANYLGVSFYETIGSEAKDFDALREIIMNNPRGIIFIDEIHALPRDFVEKLYPLMEDFCFEGQQYPQFTLMGATTELGELLKDRRPFYDRFKLILELEGYNEKDLIKITTQYKNKVFPEDIIKLKTHRKIAKNSREIPRNAIRLLEATIYLEDILKVLKSFSIIQEGYTYKDLQVLKYVALNKSGVGLEGLSNYLGTSKENYIYQIEPYLLKNNLVIRTPRGRKITQEGLNMIKKLENEIKKGGKK